MDPAKELMSRIAGEFLHLYVDLAAYFLFGLLAAGLIATFVRRSVLRRSLGGRGLLPVLKASLLGIPLPLCSCGVVPMAMSLRRQGASRGATLSFLVSTPETGVDSIAVTYALLGPAMAVIRPVAAMATAFLAGAVQVFADRNEGLPATDVRDACSVCDEDESDGHRHGLGEKVARAARFAFRDFFGDVIGWMLLGLVVASALGAFVGPGFVERHFASNALQILAMLAVSIPLYVCASATTPVAAALIAAGFSPGAALVLLLAGPATNVATIIMVWRFLGRRSAVVYVGTIALVSALLGFALDAGIGAFAVDPRAIVSGATEALPRPVSIGAAILLAALALVHFGRAAARHLSRRRHEACGCESGKPDGAAGSGACAESGRPGTASRSVDTADAGR